MEIEFKQSRAQSDMNGILHLKLTQGKQVKQFTGWCDDLSVPGYNLIYQQKLVQNFPTSASYFVYIHPQQ